MNLSSELETKLIEIAVKSVPREMCGLLIRSHKTGEITFKEVPNSHPQPMDFFRIDARAVAAVSIAGDYVEAFVHSHPRTSAMPSAEDIADMNLHGKPFVIVSAVDREVRTWRPTLVPLVGRQYIHGKQDCYTIVQDYYQRELGITLPDFERTDKWWEGDDSLYADNFRAAGFVEVALKDIRKHDAILSYWGATRQVNHALIYLGASGDLTSEQTAPCVGSRIFLHHPYGALSVRTLLGQNKLDTCAYVLRHRDLL